MWDNNLYDSGYAFFYNLKENYGIESAIQMAERYLERALYKKSPFYKQEVAFRKELLEAKLAAEKTVLEAADKDTLTAKNKAELKELYTRLSSIFMESSAEEQSVEEWDVSQDLLDLKGSLSKLLGIC